MRFRDALLAFLAGIAGGLATIGVLAALDWMETR